MSRSRSRLADLHPVGCTLITDNTHWRTPSGGLFSNIPKLWEVLELIVQDWQREVTPLQTAIDNSADVERFYHIAHAIRILEPHWLKCLFSYVMFFVSLLRAYKRFYEQLNALNRKPHFRVQHDKEPKPTPYLEKVQRIRNLSIEHIHSKKETGANSAAATLWTPILGWKTGSVCDLNQMTFGGMKLKRRDSEGRLVEEADDFEVKGIPELDQLCKEYLNQYDLVCADYLVKIQAKLPMVIGDERYF